MMIKNRIKKGMAVLLAILIFMGILPSDTARAAAGDKLKLQENYVDFNLGTDIRLYPLVVADDNPLDSGRVSAVMTHELQNAQNETVVWGYCLEPNATTAQGDTYEEAKNYASGYADKIRRENPAMYKEMCRLIWIADTLMARGFGGYTKVQICGAAQVILWEIGSGYRDAFTGMRSDSAIYDSITTGNTEIFRAIYAEMDRQLVHYEDRTDFASATASDAVSASNVITLEYSTAGGKWTKTLTDTNEVWTKYLPAVSGTVPGTNVGYSRNGNNITFTADSAITDTEVSDALKKTDTGTSADPSYIVYGEEGIGDTRTTYEGQIIAANAAADPVYQYVAFRMEVSRVSVKKTSADMSDCYMNNPLYSLSGAVYGLYASEADAKADRGRLETLTTGADGTAASSENYAVGQTLYLKEITAPAGYRLNTAVNSLTVSGTADDNVFNVTDAPVRDPEWIRLRKVNTDGTPTPSGNASLQGAEFTLNYYMSESASGTPAWTAVFVTDKDGYIILDQPHLKSGTIPYETDASGIIQFPLGYLTIEETKAPTGYKLNNKAAEGRIIQVSSGGDACFDLTGNTFSRQSDGTILFTEEPFAYALTVTKTDSELSKARAGAEYDIINRSANPVVVNGTSYAVGAVVMHIGPTGADGKATTGTVLPMGTYGIKETKAPAGLTLNTTEATVTITNANVDKDFENDAEKGSIKIVKKIEKAPSGYSIDPITLDGFQFRVQGTTLLGTTYDKTFTTDSTGTITINDLLVGSYKVTEVKNTKTNAFIVPEMQENDVTNGATATFAFTNVYKKFKVDLIKIAKGSSSTVTVDWPGTSLEGAEYTLYRNGTKVATFTTDANGKFTTGYYICGEGWTIRETKAPKGFELDPTVYTIGAVDPSQDKEKRTDTVTSPETAQPGSLKIEKNFEAAPAGYEITEADKSGFEFRITATLADGTKYDKTFKTDANGEITVEGLLPGTYTVTELANGKTTPYLIPDSQEETIEAGKSVSYTFNQVRKKFELTLTKVDKYGKSYPDFPLSGAEYTVYKNGAPVKTYTTDVNGKLTTDTYWEDTGWTIKETKAPNGYQLDPTEYSFGTVDSAQSIEITNVKVTSTDEPKPADITITKVFEDLTNVGYVLTDTNKAGFKFHIIGTLDNGEIYDKTSPTDGNGQIVLNRLIPGTYCLEEIEVPGITDNYILPEPQTFTVLPQDELEKEFDQTYKKFNFTLTKVDADSLERTEASLAGAEYTLFKGGAAVKVYTTDENGQFTSDDYICDSDWTVKETKASEGYKLDETEYEVGKVEGTQEIEIRNEEIESKEEVVTGKIMINKVTDTGIDVKLVPEEGAQFEVYLKAAGSYVDAPETERDILTIGRTGIAVSKELPYGIYTVHQTLGWEGRKNSPDFDVVIDKDSDPEEPYYYLLDNETFRSYIQVIKVDSETGETIPLAGTEFEIYDENGEKIAIQITYPSKEILTSFVTDETGSFITPVRLPYGEYNLKEVKAPEGYVLYSSPVPFTVNAENVREDEGLMLITIVVSDGPVKGRITVTKQGEIFRSVEQDGDLYVPVYEMMPLAGATFEITAATDIYTPDGTLRAEKGEVVDTITTGEDGTATSVELYLGKYEVRETSAPYGMVLNEEVQTVEFTYGGQDVEVVFEQISFTNDRQKFELSILKEMQADEDGNIDLDAALLNVEFSLYAREKMVAADGLSSEGTKTIPADGLLGTASPDEEGKIIFNVDLPVDAKVYVKETATDSHYILDKGEYDLETAYEGQDEDVVELVFNDGESVTNIPVEIRTTLFGTEGISLDEDGKTVSAYETVTLIDRVEYTGLVVGKDYTVTGTLMERVPGELGATGEAFLDEEGNEITATETFTAKTVDGYVDITFTFPGILISEKTTLVAFENIEETETGKEVAVHTDIEDEDQTVTVEIPEVEVSKKAINGTDELPGAVLIIKDKYGKEIEKWTSTDEPHKVTLPVGEYTLTELTAPKDYLVAETISFKVSVNDKHEIQVSVLDGEEYVLQDGTLIVMFDRHEPVMHTTVSANGKVPADEKHVELIQAADKTTVAVKDIVYYEFFEGGKYLLEGKLVKIEKDGTLVIIAEASEVVTAEEYKAGEWVLDFGELKLDPGKYVVFEKAVPVLQETKPDSEKTEEKTEVITPVGEPISHENPDDESQTFTIISAPPTGDSTVVWPFVFSAALAVCGIILIVLYKKKTDRFRKGDIN